MNAKNEQKKMQVINKIYIKDCKLSTKDNKNNKKTSLACEMSLKINCEMLIY